MTEQPETLTNPLAERMAGQELIKGKRTGKDSVFTHLFSEPEYRFQLFQTLHPELKGVTMEDIIPMTISNVVLDRPYNDLGLLAMRRLLILTEAQSTWSENVLPRGLMYFSQTYLEYVSRMALNLYQATALDLPEPEFYVIFTGERQDKPEELNFSKIFFGGKKVAIDITAKMIYGSNQGDIISQYVTFCHVLDEQYQKFGRTVEAVREAIRICKSQNVLREYLSRRETEVITIMLALFDQETATRNFVASVKRETEQKTTLNVNLAAIKNFMETTKWAATDVMNAMKIPMDQQSVYAAQL